VEFRPPADCMRPVKKQRERGSAFIEFVLTALVWMPLLLGTIVFGINLIRAIQVSQLARDSGHMYAYGIDFTEPQNLALLQRLAKGLNITPSGDGAVVLSKVTLVTQTDCDAAAMKVCPNNGQYVFTSIFVFGNQAYAKTKLGNPNTNYYTNGASIQTATYLSDPSLRATSFSNLLTFPPDQPGQYAFVSEVSVNSQAINWSSFSNTGSYARSIF